MHAPKTSGHVRITPGGLRTWGILVSLMILALNFNRTLQAQHAEHNCMCLKLLDYVGRIQAVISIIIIPTMLKNRQENHFCLFRSCPELSGVSGVFLESLELARSQIGKENEL